MNKKLLFFIFIFVTLSLSCFVANSFAANEVDDYLFQNDQYRQVYKDFTVARDKYLQYKTLNSKEEAIDFTKKIISQRSQTLRVYFLALKWKLRVTPSIVGSKLREELVSRLDKEIIWLNGQEEEIKNASKFSLDNLFIISDRFEDKKDSFERLSYHSLSAIILGKLRSLQSESVAVTNLLNDELAKLESTKAAELKDWLREVENKNYLSQKELEAAEINQALIEKKKGQQLAVVYSDILFSLEKAKNQLNQAYLFQKEVFNNLKNNGSRF